MSERPPRRGTKASGESPPIDHEAIETEVARETAQMESILRGLNNEITSAGFTGEDIKEEWSQVADAVEQIQEALHTYSTTSSASRRTASWKRAKSLLEQLANQDSVAVSEAITRLGTERDTQIITEEKKDTETNSKEAASTTPTELENSLREDLPDQEHTPVENLRVRAEADKLSIKAEAAIKSIRDLIQEAGLDIYDVAEVWDQAYQSYENINGMIVAYENDDNTTEDRIRIRKTIGNLIKDFYGTWPDRMREHIQSIQSEQTVESKNTEWVPETPAEKQEALANAVHKLTPVPPEEEPKVIYKNKVFDFSEAIEESDHVTAPAESTENISSIQDRIHTLAMELRGEESANTLSSRNTNTEVYKQHGPAVLAMLEAEKEYLTLYKKEKKQQGFFKTVADKFIDVDKHLPKNIADKKEQWMKARAAYLSSINESLDTRQDAHEAKNREEGKSYSRDEVMARYEQRYGARMLNVAVLGAEKAEQDARIDGLAHRDKKTIEKLYNNYQKLPTYIRIPLTFGMVAGASFTAAAATGGAVIGLGALVVATLPTTFRMGFATIAETTHNKDLKRVIEVVSQVTSLGAIGKFGGEQIASLLDAAAGTKGKAEKTLSKEHSIRDFTAADRNSKIFEKRNAARNAEENIKRHKAIGGTLGATAAAIGGGGLFGHWFKDFLTGNHTDVRIPIDEMPIEPEYADPGFMQEHNNQSFTDHTLQSSHSDGYQSPTTEELKDYNDHHIATSTEAPETTTQTPASQEAPAQTGHPHHHAHHPSAAAGRMEEHETSTAESVRITDEDRKLLMDWQTQYGGFPPHADMHTQELIARLHEDNGPDAFKDMHFDDAVPQPETPATPPDQEVQNVTSSTETETVQEQEIPSEAPSEREVLSAEDAPVADQAPVPESPQEPITRFENPSEYPGPAHDIAASENTPAAETHESESSDHSVNESYETSTESPLVVMSKYGFKIEHNEPHIYADASENMIMHGGTTDEQLKSLDAFFKDPANFGKTVIVETGTPDPITGKPDLVPFISTTSGKYGPGQIIRDVFGNPVLPPTVNDFIKKIL